MYFGLLIVISVTRTWADVKFKGFFESSDHANNWAVLVCTSRYWFNYRHVANVLSLYHSVKRLGIPDSQIILMLADDMPCNPRNPRPGTVYNNAQQHINLYGENVEVDYRGYEVTVENFIRVLTGRLADGVPNSQRLKTDRTSNLLIYMTGISESLSSVILESENTVELLYRKQVMIDLNSVSMYLNAWFLEGHGGDGFLKFQDSEEITNVDLADTIEQMWEKNRYHEMLLIVDTCQAASMYEKLYSPNVIAAASSLHHVDHSIGVYIIDRYPYYILEYLETVQPISNRTLQEFLDACPKHKCISTVGVRYDLLPKTPSKIRVTDFFGSIRQIDYLDKIYNVNSLYEDVENDPRYSGADNIAYPPPNENIRIEGVDQFSF